MSAIESEHVTMKTDARSMRVIIPARRLHHNPIVTLMRIFIWTFAEVGMLYALVRLFLYVRKLPIDTHQSRMAGYVITIIFLGWVVHWTQLGLRRFWRLAWQWTGKHELFVSRDVFVSTKRCMGLVCNTELELCDIKKIHVMEDRELPESMDVEELIDGNSYLAYQDRGLYRYMHFEISPEALGEIVNEIKRLIPQCCMSKRI